MNREYLPENIQVPPPNSDQRSENLFEYVKRLSGKHQLGLCLVAILTTALALIPIELQRRIIDTAVEAKNYDNLVLLGVVYALVLLTHQLIKFFFRMYQAWVAQSTMKNTRQRLFEARTNGHKQSTDSKGADVSVITNEVEGIGTFVGEHISDASANLMQLFGAIGYMLFVEPMLALFALLFFIPQIIIVPFMQRILNDLVNTRVDLMRELSDHAAENNKDNKEQHSTISSVYKNRMTYTLVKYATKSLINILNSLGPLTVLLLGGYMVIQGETTAGVIVAFLSGFQRISGPIRGLISFYRLSEQTNVQHCKLENWVADNQKV